MKKIITTFFAITTLFIIQASSVSAQYYQDTSAYTYTNGYSYAGNSYNSYYPYQIPQTNTYYFQNQYQNQYQNTYQVYPTSNSYQYTVGCNTYNYDAYTRLTVLVSSTCYNNTYQNQYNYHPLTNNNWGYNSGGCNQNNYYGYGYANNYNNCYPSTGVCHWQNGYQVCY